MNPVLSESQFCLSFVLTEGSWDFQFCRSDQFLVRFSLLKTAVFWFWCLVRFAGFHQLNLWFLDFVNNDGGFLDFFPNAFYGFSGFANYVAPRSRAGL